MADKLQIEGNNITAALRDINTNVLIQRAVDNASLTAPISDDTVRDQDKGLLYYREPDRIFFVVREFASRLIQAGGDSVEVRNRISPFLEALAAAKLAFADDEVDKLMSAIWRCYANLRAFNRTGYTEKWLEAANELTGLVDTLHIPFRKYLVKFSK